MLGKYIARQKWSFPGYQKNHISFFLEADAAHIWNHPLTTIVFRSLRQISHFPFHVHGVWKQLDTASRSGDRCQTLYFQTDKRIIIFTNNANLGRLTYVVDKTTKNSFAASLDDWHSKDGPLLYVASRDSLRIRTELDLLSFQILQGP